MVRSGPASQPLSLEDLTPSDRVTPAASCPLAARDAGHSVRGVCPGNVGSAAHRRSLNCDARTECQPQGV